LSAGAPHARNDRRERPCLCDGDSGGDSAVDMRTKIEHRTYEEHWEWMMVEIFQDVLSMVTMGMFLVSFAMWIGAF
jgi:hypothetical protein